MVASARRPAIPPTVPPTAAGAAVARPPRAPQATAACRSRDPYPTAAPAGARRAQRSRPCKIALKEGPFQLGNCAMHQAPPVAQHPHANAACHHCMPPLRCPCLCKNLVARSRNLSSAWVRPPMCSPMICMVGWQGRDVDLLAADPSSAATSHSLHTHCSGTASRHSGRPRSRAQHLP